jgi:NAD(P)-dependent dehydrogenase (short-subunit alcohol dehydrogenase family)
MGTVAVTGAAAGIGAATKARLEAVGHRVIGVDISAGEVVTDLSTPAGRQAAIDGVLDACGGSLDGLVTAAGVPPRAPAATIVSVNYFGTVALLSGLHAALAASGQARVVAVSSVMASTVPGVPTALVEACLADDEPRALELVASYDRKQHVAVYAATKVAIARWVRRHAWTPEWARAGIRMNVVAPGATKTAFFGDLAADDPRQENIPTAAVATADQIASWIAIMMGDDAELLCGSVIYVDGGLDARRRSDAWPSPPPEETPDKTSGPQRPVRRRWRGR